METSMKRFARWIGAAGLWLLVTACSTVAPQAPRTFETPEQAVREMSELIGTHDEQAVERFFGPDSVELISSGDPYADQENFQRVKTMIAERVAFFDFDENTRVALFGAQEWPFPVPLVRDDKGRWHFDLAAGREELLNRRIGHNELHTLTSLRAVVEAQQEYASTSRDGLPRGFARRFVSSEGKHDGLYWPPEDGGELSPLGDLLADADVHANEPRPFHGYYFRILDRQGPAAPGGAQSYMDAQGHLTRGFAVIAWPAKYGNSGIMTFMVNQRGIVFQKDLGEQTEALAKAITAFDPDAGWDPTGDAIDTDEGA